MVYTIRRPIYYTYITLYYYLRYLSSLIDSQRIWSVSSETRPGSPVNAWYRFCRKKLRRRKRKALGKSWCCIMQFNWCIPE